MKAIKLCDKKVKCSEPFKNLFTQGMVTHKTFKGRKGEWIEPSNIFEKKGDYFDNKNQKVEIGKIEKMSKSKKNVVDPEEIIST